MDDWQTPTGPLNMAGVKTFALDTETCDPNLMESGPGFITGDSYPIGFSITTDTRQRGYFPIAHEEGNCEWDAAGWLASIVADPAMTSVYANFSYDAEALWKLGITIRNKVVDIQVTDALCDENQASYTLNNIGKRRNLGTKDSGEMEEQLILIGAVKKGKPDYGKLYKLHPKFVGPYAVGDTDLTLAAHFDQLKDIEADDLHRVYELESRLSPILWDMRLRGVRVDIDKAERLNNELNKRLGELLKSIEEQSDVSIDPFSSQSLERWVNSMGITPPRTTKDNPSVGNDWLSESDNELLVKMAEYRRGEKIRRDFIEGMVLNNSHNGYLHPNWFQTRGSSFMSGNDVNGTRSGRVACTNPNLTQIPARHPLYGPMVRSLFIVEDGLKWCKRDFSSQEPRITLHYAYVLGMPGAAEVRDRYIQDPTTDYHNITMEMINRYANPPVNRGASKDINLGLAYGLGKVKMAARLGLSRSETESVLNSYHRAVPYTKKLLFKAMDIAVKRGYVTTILGRRRRFDTWENADWNAGWERPLKDMDEAIEKWGKVRRAGTYKALNAVIQGSAAEQMKTAMVNCYDAGYLPNVTIYDELGVPVEGEKQASDISEIMETAIDF
ncbi:MAG: DNA polymerase, partial [Candidatus Hermodarchaeia archaeon]